MVKNDPPTLFDCDRTQVGSDVVFSLLKRSLLMEKLDLVKQKLARERVPGGDDRVHPSDSSSYQCQDKENVIARKNAVLRPGPNAGAPRIMGVVPDY